MAKVIISIRKVERGHPSPDLLTPCLGVAVPADEMSNHISRCPLRKLPEKQRSRERDNTGGERFKCALQCLDVFCTGHGNFLSSSFLPSISCQHIPSIKSFR